MLKIELYLKSKCHYCTRVKQLLDSIGLPYVEHNILSDTLKRKEMMKRSKASTVPQIFIGNKHIGGSNDVFQAFMNGDFDPLMNA